MTGREIFPELEISYREWHIVDAPYRETIVSRVDSPCEDLMEIHDSCLLSLCDPSFSLLSHNTRALQVRFMGNHGKDVFISICSL